MKLPAFLGKLVYVVTKPGIHYMLKGTNRVYLVIKVGNEILVTKNWLGLHKTWRLPGGGAHTDEVIAHALQREICEELGIEIELEKLHPLGAQPMYEPTKRFTYYLFITEYAQKPELYVNEKEIIAAKWIKLSELSTSPLSEELKTAMLNIK